MGRRMADDCSQPVPRTRPPSRRALATRERRIGRCMSRCCCRAPCCRAKSCARSPSRSRRAALASAARARAARRRLGGGGAAAPRVAGRAPVPAAKRRSPRRRMRSPPSPATRRRPTSACGTPTRCISNSRAITWRWRRWPRRHSEDDAGALIAAANALAAEADAEFVRIGDRWFLRTAREWELHAKPLAATFGQPLHARAARGPRRRGVEPAADRDPDDVARASRERGARGARRSDGQQRVAARRRPLGAAEAPRLRDRAGRRTRVARRRAGGRHRVVARPTRRRATTRWSCGPTSSSRACGRTGPAGSPRCAPSTSASRRSPVRARSTSSSPATRRCVGCEAGPPTD